VYVKSQIAPTEFRRRVLALLGRRLRHLQPPPRAEADYDMLTAS